jgi:hypothetical protein
MAPSNGSSVGGPAANPSQVIQQQAQQIQQVMETLAALELRMIAQEEEAKATVEATQDWK